MNESTRAAISAALKGRPKSEAHRLAVSRGKKGKAVFSRRTGKTLQCETCSAEIYRPLNLLKRLKHFYCGMKCTGASKVGNIPWNKGKEFSSEIREKMSLIAKTQIRRPEDTDGLRKYWLEHHERQGEWLKGKPSWNRGKHLSEITKEKLRAARLKQVIPSKDTKIEVAVQNGLNSKGIKYEKHYPVLGQPDMAIPEKRIAIFCDGTYWHSLPKAVERDARVNKKLMEDGWTVLRYSDKEILNEPDSVIQKIELAIGGALA